MAISLIRPEVVAGPSSRNLSPASGDRPAEAESASGSSPPLGRWAISGRAVVRVRAAVSTKPRRTGIRIMGGPVEVLEERVTGRYTRSTTPGGAGGPAWGRWHIPGDVVS